MTRHPWQRPLLPGAFILLLPLLGCSPGAPLATAPPVPSERITAQLDQGMSLPILRFSRVRDRRHPERQIYRGGQPSDAALQRLADLGFKTIVSLLNAGDGPQDAADVAREREIVTRRGVTFINLPIPDGDVPSAATIDELIRIASDSDRHPVFVHCLWGRDRTGAVIAAYRIHANGDTTERALTEMRSFGYERAMYPELEQFVRDYAARRA